MAIAPPLLQRLEDRTRRLALGEDQITGEAPEARDEAIEKRVFERRDDHRHRHAQAMLQEGDQLPVPEVPRKDQHAASERRRGEEVLHPFVDRDRVERCGEVLREMRRVGDDPAEVRERGARHPFARRGVEAFA
jgi:hypothetical protein